MGTTEGGGVDGWGKNKSRTNGEGRAKATSAAERKDGRRRVDKLVGWFHGPRTTRRRGSDGVTAAAAATAAATATATATKSERPHSCGSADRLVARSSDQPQVSTRRFRSTGAAAGLWRRMAAVSERGKVFVWSR